MNFSTIKPILLRLFNYYVKKHFGKLMLALLLSFAVAGGTAAIAWLLDPAVKQIFVEQNHTMLMIIPIAIVLAFSVKGISLYLARTLMIRISAEVMKALKVEMASSILISERLLSSPPP